MKPIAVKKFESMPIVDRLKIMREYLANVVKPRVDEGKDEISMVTYGRNIFSIEDGAIPSHECGTPACAIGHAIYDPQLKKVADHIVSGFISDHRNLRALDVGSVAASFSSKYLSPNLKTTRWSASEVLVGADSDDAFLDDWDYMFGGQVPDDINVVIERMDQVIELLS